MEARNSVIAIVGLAGLLAACGGEPVREREPVQVQVNAPTLFATLSQESGRWRLTRISPAEGNVNLFTGRWNGESPERTCWRGIVGAVATAGCPRDTSFLSVRPTATLVLTPVMWPIGLLFAPFTLLTGEFRAVAGMIAPVEVRYRFDRDAFDAAYRQAWDSGGYPARFLPAAEEYRELRALGSKHRESLADLDRAAEYRQQLFQEQAAYRQSLARLARESIVIRVNDLSGFWTGGDRLTPDSLNILVESPEPPQFEGLPPDEGPAWLDELLFPAADLDDLVMRLGRARAEFPARLEGARERAAGVDAENRARLERYVSSLRQNSGRARVALSLSFAEGLRRQGFAFEPDFAEIIEFRDGEPVVPVAGQLTLRRRDSGE